VAIRSAVEGEPAAPAAWSDGLRTISERAFLRDVNLVVAVRSRATAWPSLMATAHKRLASDTYAAKG
jgi:hypothetical protein